MTVKQIFQRDRNKNISLKIKLQLIYRINHFILRINHCKSMILRQIIPYLCQVKKLLLNAEIELPAVEFKKIYSSAKVINRLQSKIDFFREVYRFA